MNSASERVEADEAARIDMAYDEVDLVRGRREHDADRGLLLVEGSDGQGS
jgi:hypothetical protein